MRVGRVLSASLLAGATALTVGIALPVGRAGAAPTSIPVVKNGEAGYTGSLPPSARTLIGETTVASFNCKPSTTESTTSVFDVGGLHVNPVAVEVVYGCNNGSPSVYYSVGGQEMSAAVGDQIRFFIKFRSDHETQKATDVTSGTSLSYSHGRKSFYPSTVFVGLLDSPSPVLGFKRMHFSDVAISGTPLANLSNLQENEVTNGKSEPIIEPGPLSANGKGFTLLRVYPGSGS